MTYESRPIIALDFPNVSTTKKFLSRFESSESLYVKIGMELFYSSGPEIVEVIQAQGYSIFLDLKLHDIPNTVKSAMAVLAGLGIDMVNVHATGGVDMMSAAKDGLLAGTPAGKVSPKLIAVTQLTSTSEEVMRRDQLIQATLQESVSHYAQLTAQAGLDGVVCSAQEVRLIKAVTRSDFLCVTPGIRPSGTAVGDQKRVMTPQDAHQIGSDYIVVGRPITQALDPLAAYKAIKKEWTASLIN